jgi:thiol:disulfide interchange protein
MLLAAALWFVYSLLPDWLLMVLVALLLAGCGMMLRAIDQTTHHSKRPVGCFSRDCY